MRLKMRLIGLTLLASVTACAGPPGAKAPGLLGGVIGNEAAIAADVMLYGFPDTEMLRYRKGYVLSYDAARRVPRWVAERLDASVIDGDVSDEAREFRADDSLAPALRVESSDFEESGYIRGRLAAAANHRADPAAFRETYLLSNVAPQLGDTFRATVWVGLEQRVRDWARASQDLYVITGTLFLPTEEDGVVHYPLLGERRIAVPTHFYKVLLRENGRERDMLAFLVPHAPAAGEPDYADYVVSVDEIERLSGLDFFPKLANPTQATLEAAENQPLWPLPDGKNRG